jgi:hypothetical protein
MQLLLCTQLGSMVEWRFNFAHYWLQVAGRHCTEEVWWLFGLMILGDWLTLY